MKFSSPVTEIKYVSEKYEKLLNKLGIFTVKDLLTYFPRGYTDTSEIKTISDILLSNDEESSHVVKATVNSFNNIYIRGRKSLQKIKIEDDSGETEIAFFNQPYLKNVFKVGDEYLISGKIKIKGKKKNFYANNYERIEEENENLHLGRISPEYKLTSNLSKKWIRNRVKQIFEENLDFSKLNNLSNLVSIDLKQKIYNSHFPENFESLESDLRDLSILELVDVHLKIRKNQKPKLTQLQVDLGLWKELLDEFLDSLPFELTQDQQNVLFELKIEIEKGNLLNCLVQGDVGSGKTIIAIFLSLFFVKNGYQSVVLAPTTILAKQHFDNFNKFLKKFGIDIDLVTSNTKSDEPSQIAIGTSAVLARKARIIKNIGLVIVDEQHRFGVTQREDLLKPLELDEHTPNFVNMTATPIPRTIAETFFTDLTVSTIKSKPKNRKEIKTFVVPEKKREDSYKWIKEKIDEGDQVYWICPLVEESEKMQSKAATETFESLKKIYPDLNIDLLHGRMKADEKSKIMDGFAKHNSDILVSTSVIEVGVDVANATIMIIENVERFGLAQLHQIRGRVGRSEKQSYCFVFHGDEIASLTKDRLNFFANHSDGLEISEYDLSLRGPGEVYGTKQSGIPDLKIAKLNDLELIKKSKNIADKAWEEGIRRVELFR